MPELNSALKGRNEIKKRKKAEIEAKKAAIRAEDIAKGVFVPVSYTHLDVYKRQGTTHSDNSGNDPPNR